MTTTSLIRPTWLVATVGEMATACECPAEEQVYPCPHHASEPCSEPAEWMCSFGHTQMGGEAGCRPRVVALCDPCLVQVRATAEAVVKLAGLCLDGRCPSCGGPIAQLSDIIRSVVAL